MNKDLTPLFEKNREWASRMVNKDPDYFRRHTDQQKPPYLWIGCSDSRVPASQVMGAGPGDVFVHRNIANMVNHNDLSVLSVIQYAVEVLKVRHIIVCGHYSCGGVKASLEQTEHGLVDNWIRPIKQIYETYKPEFEGLSERETVNRLCEWNVRQQVVHVAQTTILQKAWRQKQDLSVHGLIYNIRDGKLLDLDCSAHGPKDLPDVYHLR